LLLLLLLLWTKILWWQLSIFLLDVIESLQYEKSFNPKNIKKSSNNFLLHVRLVVLPVVLVLVLLEYHTLQLAAQRISMNVYRIPIVRDSVVNEDIRLDSSSSDCTISLMEHFRWHRHCRVL
jgi:hypothetical protein